MPYHDTLTEDIDRAKEIIEAGKPEPSSVDGLPAGLAKRFMEEAGTIIGVDVYPAYQLLKSFVKVLEEFPVKASIYEGQFTTLDEVGAQVKVLNEEVSHNRKRAEGLEERITKARSYLKRVDPRDVDALELGENPLEAVALSVMLHAQALAQENKNLKQTLNGILLKAQTPAEEKLREALEESLKLQSHYAGLLNHYDDGHRKVFKSAEEWVTVLDESKKVPG